MSEKTEVTEIKTEEELLAALNRGSPVMQGTSMFVEWLREVIDKPPSPQTTNTDLKGDGDE